MAGWTGKKANVFYTKIEEPSFLKKFKEQVGYKEDKGLSDKFEVLPKGTDADLEDGDDELPQVVQLKPGDISEEEYKTIIEKEKGEQVSADGDDEVPPDGRILFRKPADKRSKDAKNELKVSTKKVKKDAEDEPKKDGEDEPKKTSKKNKTKEGSNKKLLSFDEDEDDCDT